MVEPGRKSQVNAEVQKQIFSSTGQKEKMCKDAQEQEKDGLMIDWQVLLVSGSIFVHICENPALKLA